MRSTLSVLWLIESSANMAVPIQQFWRRWGSSSIEEEDGEGGQEAAWQSGQADVVKSELVLLDRELWFESDTSCSLEHLNTCLPVGGCCLRTVRWCSPAKGGAFREKT